MNMYAYANMYMYAITIVKKQGKNLKESGERYMGRKEKGREKCNYYNLKNKEMKITTTLETNYTQP